MNKFDEVYEIRLAKETDIDDIMQFICEEWDANHILGNSKAYFIYEHVIEQEVTFIIARNRDDNRIYSLLGYIYASRDKDNLDIWTGIWKTKDGAMALLGMELMRRLKSLVNARSITGIGDNPNTTIKLVKLFLRHYTGKMNQYYMVSGVVPIKLASIKKKVYNCADVVNGVYDVEKASDVNQLKNLLDKVDKTKVPYKDAWYVKHKYFDNPIYKYNVFVVKNNKDVCAALVLREQEWESSMVGRIVDFFGDSRHFSMFTGFFKDALNKYEYIDFYALGFDEKAIFDSGFVKRDEYDENVIPNYFYPFERRNVDIWVDSSNDNTLYLKGDGDQDRPNFLG